MEKDLISIIVPIYNVQKYLVRCLESIRNQTYTTLEVLCIDDGSTDGSGLLADDYADLDSRFKVFHTKNRGVSAARNFGLDNISGEYVAFIDADDFVCNEYIERLYEVSQEKKVLHVISLPFDSEDGVVDKSIKNNSNKKVTVLSIKREFDYTKPYAYGTVWGGIVHKSLVNDIRFISEIYVGEDELFYAQLLKKNETIAILEEKLYIYMIYKESASKGTYDERKKTNVLAWKMIEEKFNDYPRVFRNRLKARCCVTYLEELKKMLISNYKDKAWHALLLKNVRRTLKYLLISSYSKKCKMSAIFYCLFPKLFEMIYIKRFD